MMLRLRFGLMRLMLVVAIVAILLAAGLDLFLREPMRRARREMIARHERIAAYYAREAAREVPFYPLGDDLKRDLRRASEWHGSRAREIREAAGFDPVKEGLRDERQNPSDLDITGRLYNARLINEF
jgi:type II secretory pathway pseudopilin PulG